MLHSFSNRDSILLVAQPTLYEAFAYCITHHPLRREVYKDGRKQKYKDIVQ